MSRIVVANKQSIIEAAEKIKSGEIVVLPTETVYGLGADATNKEAVAKIFAAKNRPAKNPLIIHVTGKEHAAQFAQLNKSAEKMMAAFWPGALTLVLEQSSQSDICDLVSAGLSTIAVRCPNHPVMQEVIKLSGKPIAAPSANNSGEPSATTPNHAAQSLGDNIDMILAAGNCEVGLESTVLDLSGNVPTILRPGSITLEDIQEFLPDVILSETAQEHAPKSPGQMFKHYAPSIPVRLNVVDVEKGGSVKDLSEESFRNLSENSDLEEAARNLFMMLRDLDSVSNQGIAVMNIPDQGIGMAINERLARAAKG